MKVAFCCPTRDRPHQAHLDSLERAVPLLDSICEHAIVYEVGCPYISGARATMLGKALKWGADQIVFLDDDVSFRPEDLAALVLAEGDVVGGTYRYKLDEEKYMGRIWVEPDKGTLVRKDGAVHMRCMPAGFLKVTRQAVERFMGAYPELIIDADGNRNVDLFNHGAYKGVWWGEDYAFCRRWNDIGGQVWCLPHLHLDHHGKESVFVGRYWDFLQRKTCESSMPVAA